MPRYPHFLARCKGDVHPTRIVGVSVRATAKPADEQEARVVEHLSSWHVAGWASAGKEGEADWYREGTEAAALWAHVDYALRRGGIVWAVSLGACRVWGLLGLWQALEDGRVYLDGWTDATASALLSSVRAHTDPPGSAGGSGQGEQARKGRLVHPGGSVLEDPPTVIRARRPGLPGTLLIVDSRNWGIDTDPAALSGVAEARWARDGLMRLDALLRSEGWGTLCASAGAQAWRIWRTAFADHTVYVHRCQEALDLEGAAYYGGRCECRFLGVYPDPVYHVDFRSLYPAVCAEQELPALLEGLATGMSAVSDDKRPDARQRIAAVELQTAEPAYPYRTDGETYYPVGRFRTVLAGPELTDAQMHGRIRSVGRVAAYQGSGCLSGYARALWSAMLRTRAARDDTLSGAIKRLAVCLPGRCGQRGYRWIPIGARGVDPVWGEWWRFEHDGTLRHYRAIGGHVEVEVKEEWAPEAIPAIAAWVCSAGRMALLSAIRQAGWANVLYYDTDSLIVTERGWQYLWLDRRIRHDTLGMLRFVSRADRCEVRGIKHYLLDGARTCSGLPKGSVLPSGLPDHYWYQQHARGQVAAGHRPQAALTLHQYTRESAYHHGVVGKDGWVTPLEVNEQ